MISWRITKYNPKYRDEKGIYQRDEWTSCYDIGKCFDGKEFTVNDYLTVEDAYVHAILSFIERLGIETLVVKNIEKHGNNVGGGPLVYDVEMLDILQSLHEGNAFGTKKIEPLCRLVLREQLWCKLEHNDLFIHFGYDYYMYIGCSTEQADIINQIKKDGLYVEKMESPYLNS